MKHWRYSNARGHSVGRMICTCCKKPITSGDFRYYETKEAYRPEHRACATGNNEWAKYDAEKRQRSEDDARRLSAFRSFAKQWDTESLDDDIAQMERSLANI